MGTYLLVAAADGYVAPDGSVQAKGTAFNRILWDDKAPTGFPAGLEPIPDDGRALWQPAVQKPTAISKRDFWLRLTQAEQMALVQASLANAAIAWWLHNAQTAETIDLLDPQTQQGMAALVSAGLLTQARATAILTP